MVRLQLLQFLLLLRDLGREGLLERRVRAGLRDGAGAAQLRQLRPGRSSVRINMVRYFGFWRPGCRRTSLLSSLAATSAFRGFSRLRRPPRLARLSPALLGSELQQNPSRLLALPRDRRPQRARTHIRVRSRIGYASDGALYDPCDDARSCYRSPIRQLRAQHHSLQPQRLSTMVRARTVALLLCAAAVATLAYADDEPYEPRPDADAEP